MKRRIAIPQPAPEESYLIPAPEWSELVRWLWRERIIGVSGSLAARRVPAWATRLSYDWDRESWVARVRAGAVNGLPPLHPDGRTDLLRAPEIILPTPRVESSIPPYLSERYLFTAAESATLDGDLGVRTLLDPARAAAISAQGGPRTLWSLHLGLRIARPITALDVGDDGIPRVRISGAVGRQASVYVSRGAIDPESERSALDLLRGMGGASAQDTLSIASLYWVSRPGADPDAPPGPDAIPWVHQRQYYSLSYAVRLPDIPPEGLDVRALADILPLPGTDIIRGLEEELRRNQAAADLLARRTEVAGRWWSV
jgi:hypothetical protein